MSEQLEPWGERVLVAPDPAQRETTTGILIPATAQKKARRDRHGGLAMTRPGDRLTETLFLPNPDGR